MHLPVTQLSVLLYVQKDYCPHAPYAFAIAEQCNLRTDLPSTASRVYDYSMECLKEVLEVCCKDTGHGCYMYYDMIWYGNTTASRLIGVN
jgi:hypothetical protein